MTPYAMDRLVGASPAIRTLQEEISCAARSDATVLITGESGVGKEVTARLIHQRSARRSAPFAAINCAGVPETLLESELFGHTRGSFTGAYRDRQGLLEAAHRGSIFLDEIGEMSWRMQGLLLRFLETGEIQKVGGQRASGPVDGRIIAASNRDLAQMIAARSFRKDLFYRLNVIRITVPPLRERPEDVQALLTFFLATAAERYGIEAPGVSSEAMAQLMAYPWPGNARELRNVAERLIVRAGGRLVTPADLPPEVTNRSEAIAVQELRPAPNNTNSLYDRMVNGRESFWSVVYDPFMLRDITREQLRQIVRRGLSQTRGSYGLLVQLFNMEPDDGPRFVGFLRKHQCHLPAPRPVGGPASLGRPNGAG
jgi:transcriptional regulator with PAS, ATPase and Fis domain